MNSPEGVEWELWLYKLYFIYADHSWTIFLFLQLKCKGWPIKHKCKFKPSLRTDQLHVFNFNEKEWKWKPGAVHGIISADWMLQDSITSRCSYLELGGSINVASWDEECRIAPVYGKDRAREYITWSVSLFSFSLHTWRCRAAQKPTGTWTLNWGRGGGGGGRGGGWGRVWGGEEKEGYANNEVVFIIRGDPNTQMAFTWQSFKLTNVISHFKLFWERGNSISTGGEETKACIRVPNLGGGC